MDVLKKEYNLYRKSAKDGNKKAQADMKKINRLKTKIKSIEERNGIVKDREGSKYKEKCKKIRLIIRKHQLLKVLKQKRNLYLKNNKRKHEEASKNILNYYNNLKKIREYEENNNVKSAEKFEMGIESISTQKSIESNEEQPQPSTYGGIGSRIIDISMPERMKTEVNEENVCFIC